MDTIAQLALMAKAKLVFESPGTFLSFPALTPITYKAEDLNFANALDNPEAGRTLTEFSRFVNLLPEGTVFRGEDNVRLWQAYDQWLVNMVLPSEDSMTPDEKAQYEQAKALLTVIDANGLTPDSQVVVTYKQYRDAWYTANESYKSQQLTAMSSNDVAVQTQWKNVDEPRLRTLVSQALADWENKGNKAIVEHAQAVVMQYSSRSASSIWNEWRRAFDPKLDLLTDPSSNEEYAPTGFSPSNIFAQDWPTFHISGAEIAQLAQSAPKELRDLFGDNTGTSIVTSLSFEFRSAVLVRFWWKKEVTEAHFWKFHEGVPPLSDGNTPPNGSWPYYITAVVFARNIQVTTQAAPDQPQPVKTLPPIKTNPNIIYRLPPRHLLADQDEPMIITARPAMGVMQAARQVDTPIAATPVAAATLQSQSMAPRKFQMSPVLRLNAAIYPILMPVSPPPSVTNNDISILAFICRRLPKTPDPDASLKW